MAKPLRLSSPEHLVINAELKFGILEIINFLCDEIQVSIVEVIHGINPKSVNGCLDFLFLINTQQLALLDPVYPLCIILREDIADAVNLKGFPVFEGRS